MFAVNDNFRTIVLTFPLATFVANSVFSLKALGAATIVTGGMLSAIEN